MILLMRDFVTLDIRATENKTRLFECKDSKETSGHKLLVTVAASHAGVVGGNMRFYRPDKMAEGLPSWMPSGRIPSPVLLHHDKHGECVGRVMKSRYVDESADYLSYGLKTNYFCDARGEKKLSIYDSIDWIVENLQGKVDNFPGLGYTELGLKITNAAAIQKIQNGEFMGVSVGFGSDSGVCSVCHTDWAKDSQCEHKLGRRYHNKLAYLITGKHINKEISFVNFPADPFARIKGTEALDAMADSLATKFFFLGLPLRRQEALVSEPEYTDSLRFDSDIELITEAEMDKSEIDGLLVRTKGELLKDEALDLRTTLGGIVTTEMDADSKRRVKRALVNLDSLVRKNGWTLDAVTKETIEGRIGTLAETLATLSDEAKITYCRKLEIDAKTFGLEFTMPKLEDAATEATTSGVVPATTEEKPAVVAEDLAKTEPPAVPAKIADPVVPVTVELSDNVKAAITGLKFTDSEKGKSFVAALVALESAAASIPDEERWVAQDALYTLWEKINKTNSLDWAKKRLSEDNEAKDMLVSKDEWAQIHDELTALDTDIKKIEGDNTVLQASNRRLIEDQKHLLATQLVFGRVFSGDQTVKNFNADELRAEIEKKAARSLASLTDAMADLLDSLPVAMKGVSKTPAVASIKDSQAAETAKEISDSAQITGTKEEPGVTHTDSVEGEGTKDQPYNLPIGRQDLLKRMARRRHQQITSKTE